MYLNKSNLYYVNTSLQKDNKQLTRDNDLDIDINFNNNYKTNDNNSCKMKGILSCIGGILIYLSLGSIYTFGNMLPYFARYMSVINDNGDYSYYLSLCNYIFAFIICGQSIFFPIGGILGQKYGIKLIIFIGCFIQSICGILSTYFYASSPYYVWITYGLLVGIGIGISYPNILVIVMKWYPNNKGFVNGLVLAGFGSSALIFDKIQTMFINPNNEEFTAMDIDIFPYSFLLLGSIYFIMQIIGICLIQTPPPAPAPSHTQPIPLRDTEYIPLISHRDPDIQLMDNDNAIDKDKIINVLCDIKFYQLYFIFFIDGMIIVFIATQWKIFSLNYLNISNDSYLSLMGSISSIFNGAGRIIFGLILDKTQSFRYTLGTINIILCGVLFSWPYCINNSILSFIWVCLLFGLFASNFSIFPTIISMLYGNKNIGINVGLIFTSQIFSAFIGIYVLEELQVIINNWEYMCYWIASIQLVGAIVAFLFTPNNKLSDSCKLNRKL